MSLIDHLSVRKLLLRSVVVLFSVLVACTSSGTNGTGEQSGASNQDQVAVPTVDVAVTDVTAEAEPVASPTEDTSVEDVIELESVVDEEPEPLTVPVKTVALQEEIVFPAGASSGSVEHELAPQTAHTFSLYALGGQLVEIFLSDNSNRYDQLPVMLAPAGGRPLGVGLSSGSFSDESPALSLFLPETGSYELTLTAPDEWESGATYSLTVSIPALDAGGSPSVPDNFVLFGYGVAEMVDLAGYTAVLYSKPDSFPGDGRVLIFSGNELLDEVPYALQFNQLNGEDITQTGVPNLIVESYTGGAHCCSKTSTFDLYENQLAPVLDLPPSECGGSFSDLDGDGVYEYVTCDDSFAYVYCSYAASPFPSVVMGFDGVRYVPVSEQFGNTYQDEIASSVERARNASQEDSAWDGTNKCAVLPAVLSYLYSGQGDAARRIFNETYQQADAELFWAEMLNTIADSPLYVAPADLPHVILPDYYRLESGADCPAVANSVLILPVNEPTCGTAVAIRDIYWLAGSLQQAGILQIDESLEYEDVNCTESCVVQVVVYGSEGVVPMGQVSFVLDETASGHIRYEAVDGALIGRWRLRGDMTWERLE